MEARQRAMAQMANRQQQFESKHKEELAEKPVRAINLQSLATHLMRINRPRTKAKKKLKVTR